MFSSCFNFLKVTLLTTIVLLAFVYSSLGWRHFETNESTRVIVGAIILISMYSLMVFELVNRNLAALIGAAVSVAAYDCLLEPVRMEQIILWEDLETLALLFGMMIIVNVLAISGLFDMLAIWAYKQAAGRFWLLIVILSFVTAFLSAFIDNVSAMLLVAPTLIKLAELERLDPRYILIIMIIFCNIGGCATPVGDPPNLIIIGDPLVSELGISFGIFVSYCAPCVVLTISIILIYLKLTYKSKDSFKLANLSSLYDEKSDSTSIQVMELDGSQNYGVSVRRVDSVRLSDGAIKRIMATNMIRSKTILFQSVSVLVVTVVLFFIQSLPGVNLTLGWISLFAGLTLLILSSGTKLKTSSDDGNNEEEEERELMDDEESDTFELVINNIEWSTLIFFFSLFIVMEVMAKLGLINFVGQQISHLIDLLPAGLWREIGALTIILWSSGVASALIDNVPFTSMMIKVLGAMIVANVRPGSDVHLPASLDVKALVFALAFGACYGGNGTIIGASANLVTAGVAGRHGYPISFNGFFRFSVVPTLISLVVANIYLVVVFVLLKL
uniref:P protein n=1 Tax=Aceria tosichella TaxID=561515 RepID=A0A6G1SHH2_9ACAR